MVGLAMRVSPPPSRLAVAALALFSTAAAPACLNQMILDGTIESTRRASATFDTLSDYETARAAAAGGLVQLEGMHELSPKNEDALFMLVQSWTGYASAFIEDDLEVAIERDDEVAEGYHRSRARNAYARALHYGKLLLERRAGGFDAATKNADTMRAYLAAFDRDDAENLLWTGVAWLGRGDVAQDDPAMVATLYVGVALVERSVALDPNAAYGLGLAVLGAYHARTPDAELAQAKGLFEQSLKVTGRKALTTQLLYAETYACSAHDRTLYDRLLREIGGADDPLPEQRLENTVAKRRAARYLGKAWLSRCGFSE